MEQLKQKVLTILTDAAWHDIGKSSSECTRITRTSLMRETGATDRAVRDSIHHLRRDGHKIISSPDRSGYYLGNSDAWNAFCDRERSAALARMYRKTFENDKQIRIRVEAVG